MPFSPCRFLSELRFINSLSVFGGSITQKRDDDTSDPINIGENNYQGRHITVAGRLFTLRYFEVAVNQSK